MRWERKGAEFSAFADALFVGTTVVAAAFIGWWHRCLGLYVAVLAGAGFVVEKKLCG